MPQSPVIEKFVDKQINYRMSKSLDNMSKALNIGTAKNKVLTESNSNNDDILIDDDIFENEDQ